MKFPVLRAYSIAYLLFLYAPILLLPIFAFNSGTIIAFPLKGFTTEWFSQMAGNTSLRSAVYNSLTIACSTAVFATVLGIFAARASTRYRFPLKGGIMGLIMLPLVLPEIIVGMSLLVVLLGMGVQLSLLTVILGHTLLCLPYT
ncbi:MAG: ABC transporter permease, partial [Paracoccus sp. (in: a-proteobacteria)]|nr:ABC transporter permease [Paracoccus sp. (in: a-proteobacteria)]